MASLYNIFILIFIFKSQLYFYIIINKLKNDYTQTYSLNDTRRL